MTAGGATTSAWAFGLSAGATKIAGALLQVFLGFIFLPEDFGLLALFTSVALFANALRDGGVKNELIRLRLTHSDSQIPQAYWLAWMVNGLLALALALLAKPLALLYGAQELQYLILCLAITYPLGTLWSVCGPLIQTGHSAKRYVSIEVQGELIRLTSSVVLLACWPNPLALAVGIALQSAWLSFRSAAKVRFRMVQPWPGATAVVDLWRRTHWLMSGTLAAALLQSGDYVALGLVASTATLGAYYFAYSLPAQAGLVAVALGDSLLLHLQRQRTPQRTALLATSTRQLVTLTSLLTFTLAVCLPSLEQAIWRGKWAFAVPAAQILAVAFPFRLTFIIQKVALITAGNHAKWAALTMAQGVGMALTAVLVGSLTASLNGIAFWIGLYIASSTIMALGLALRPDGIRFPTLFALIVRGLGPAVLATMAGTLVLLILREASAPHVPLLELAVCVSAMLSVGGVALRRFDVGLYLRLLSPARRAVLNRFSR